MAETLTLTSAEITPQVTTTDYRPVAILLDFEHALLIVRLRGTNGERREVRYGGSIADGATQADRDKAIALMTALNKANLSTKSLQRRVLEQLVADGFLAGAVTGAPE
jgi:hypothetical protein